MNLNDLIGALEQETRVLSHLASKAPADRADWRPTEGQRSLLELLQYITHCGEIGLVNVATGTWEHAEPLMARSATLGIDDIASELDAQLGRMKSVIEGIDPSTMGDEVPLPWGQMVTRGRALLEMALKPMSAYRMQLFLYLKQSGSTELNSMNCWVGMDPPDGDGETETDPEE